MKNTHGSIARNLINDDPEYFKDLYTEINGFRRELPPVGGDKKFDFIHYQEMLLYVANQLQNTGLDNASFVKSVCSMLQTYLRYKKR